ncbi:MAG TPA: type IV secretion system DNA-binding domain-containing protein [Candidatus Binatia bacterium]|jgi:hypothetical protein|nr:type IV secretion system DNA-binding domain-containing protein [Candidatus Binatia bacterium]
MAASVEPYEHDHENEVILFGETNFRNQRRKFGIKTDDRRRHMYVLGKTGMGKTTLLENMVLADVYAGHGLAYVDPHGDTAEKFLDFIPPHRINDVVYFNPADMEFPIGFNILETVDESQKHLVAAGLMGVFKKIWPDVWSSRMEYILLNTIMALLDFPGSTLLGINRLLSDAEYRNRVVSLIQDPVVKTFWVKEFASFSEKYRTEAVAPLQNKVGQFLSATIIRNIVAQVKSTINMREIMDTRKILIVNLAKGRIGEENSRLLGAMIITRLQLSAMERVDMPEKDRQDFYLYVDEFQNFATQSFANILSEARKYRLALIVAHQYIEQLEEEVRAAIFGNVGSLIIFRVGAADATFMEQEFTPRFTPEDLVNLKKFEVYLKLMIDGASSEPFSAATLPPIAVRTGSTEKVIKVSRERYSTQRKVIEDKVIKWSGFGTVDTGVTLTTEEEKDAEAAEIAKKIEELEKSSPDVGEMARPADGGGFGAKKKKTAQFQIPCVVCGKISELTFEPDWSKPWYCKEHLEMKQKGLLPKQPPRPASAAPAAPPRPPRDAAPPPIKVLPPEPEAKPISLTSLVPREAPPGRQEGARPQEPRGERGQGRRDDHGRAKEGNRGRDERRRDDRPKQGGQADRGERRPDRPPRPLPPPDVAGIPVQSHKPRIVMGGGDDDREVLMPPKPKDERPPERETEPLAEPARAREEAPAPERREKKEERPPKREQQEPRHEKREEPARREQPPKPPGPPPVHTKPPAPPSQEPPKSDEQGPGWKPGQVIKF